MADAQGAIPAIVNVQVVPPVDPYQFVIADETVEDGITEANSLRQILHWIGFRIEAQRTSLVEDCFGSFRDLKALTENDVASMASDYAGRTQNNGRMYFGTRRTKCIKALVHWINDFDRISKLPSIVGLNENTFKEELDRALVRDAIRKSLKSQTPTTAEAASPGPLKSEKMWKEWEEKFVNYLRTHLGVNGVPLAYVIREDEDPDHDGTFPDFISQTIACAPLQGETFDADKLAVFNMVVSFTTGQPSGDWIKDTYKYSCGRRSIIALRNHFAGEGNATRQMAEADRLFASLHYKSERAMPFETFLTQCQKMYNIREKEGDPMNDGAKVRFLFQKVQHKDLQGAINALKAQQTAGTIITYTMAANHLAVAVSELPEYIAKNRNVSTITTTNDEKTSIYDASGSIITGHYPNWKSLSKADKSKVIAERKRLGISKGRNDRGHKDEKAAVNTVNQLKEQLKKYKRQVKALKRHANDDDGDTDVDVDAGDEFGGKAAKKKNKKNGDS